MASNSRHWNRANTSKNPAIGSMKLVLPLFLLVFAEGVPMALRVALRHESRLVQYDFQRSWCRVPADDSFTLSHNDPRSLRAYFQPKAVG
jgi:hypothetical protein